MKLTQCVECRFETGCMDKSMTKDGKQCPLFRIWKEKAAFKQVKLF